MSLFKVCCSAYYACSEYSAAGVYYSESDDELLSPSSHDSTAQSLTASQEGPHSFTFYKRWDYLLGNRGKMAGCE